MATRMKVVLLGHPQGNIKDLVEQYMKTLFPHEKTTELLDVTEIKTRVKESVVELVFVEITGFPQQTKFRK